MATKGFPGTFPGGLSTGYLSIGAVQKNKSGTERGFPGIFPGGLTAGYLNIGAVQKEVTEPEPPTTGVRGYMTTNTGYWG